MTNPNHPDDAWIEDELEQQKQIAVKTIAAFVEKNGDFCGKSERDQQTELFLLLGRIDLLQGISRMSARDIARLVVDELRRA